MSEDYDQIVQSLRKPNMSEILAFAQWFSKVVSSVRNLTMPENEKEAGFMILGSLLGTVSQEDIVELGKILLQGKGESLKTEDIDIGWLSEAIAIWFEKADIGRVIKNARRAAVSFREMNV